jgi:hypothetical protein
MKLDRISYSPGAALEFFEEALGSLGALCERTWHDRLEVVAEHRAAKLWNSDGRIHSTELKFAEVDSAEARNADSEVFPGCPLTFKATEALMSGQLVLDRALLDSGAHQKEPDEQIAAKLWRSQMPETSRLKFTSGFKRTFHFNLVAVVRTDIQAIEQHWFLNRLAIALPGGEPDLALAADLPLLELASNGSSPPGWPEPKPDQWGKQLENALMLELGPDLDDIKRRQEKSLRKELDRIDDYFDHYEAELSGRRKRSAAEAVKIKVEERIAAAKTERLRRRQDQVSRHEIRICPRIDGLLLLAEPAWEAETQFDRNHQSKTTRAIFVPRSRRWLVDQE